MPPFSTPLNTIRVYSDGLGYFGPDTGTTESADPVPGTLTFVPSNVLMSTSQNKVLYPDPNGVTVNVGSDGTFSVRLAATDDPDLTPTGWHWTVRENWTGGESFTFSLPVSSPGGEVKYTALRTASDPGTPVVGHIASTEKGTAGGVATLDGTTKVPVAQLGTGSAGAGLLFLADDRTWKSAGAGSGGDPTLSGDVTGLGSANTISNSAVTTAKLNDGAVTTAKIGDSQVTSAKLADGTIVNADVSASAAIAETKLSMASDAVAATPSRRSLGTGATQAAAGNHGHSTLAPKSETIFVFDNGADALAARPTGYAQVYWTGSVRPQNMTEDDIWNDPAGMAAVETFMDDVSSGNEWVGTKTSGSVLGFDGINGVPLWTSGTTDTSGEAFQVMTAFGPAWGRHDTRRQACVRSPGVTPDTSPTYTTTASELHGVSHHRLRMDLRAATQVRISVCVTSALANGSFRAQFATTDGGTFAALSSTANSPSVSLAATGTIAGTWVPIASGAQIDTAIVRIVGVTSSGSGTVSFGNLYIETR